MVLYKQVAALLQANVDLTELARDDCQQTLVMTIMGGLTQINTKQDVADMPFIEFAMLTAVYNAMKVASSMRLLAMSSQAQCAAPSSIPTLHVVKFLSLQLSPA